MIGADDCFEIEKNSLSKYLESSNEPLLKKAAEEGVLKTLNEVKDKESIEKEHTQLRSEKTLHGQFDKATGPSRGKQSWDWLRKAAKGVLKTLDGVKDKESIEKEHTQLRSEKNLHGQFEKPLDH